MATLSKPLVSAAALASAAAVAIATPAIMPSIGAPTPAALSMAKVNLTDFATLLTLTPEDFINTLFDGYGFTLSPNQPENPDWAAEYVGTNCNFSCSVTGPSGVAYMALDALINGNTPYTPEADVKVSALNYFFEGGASSGAQYLVSQPFGDPKSPLYNPAIAKAIALAFQGTYAFTTLYVQALDTFSKLAQAGIPLAGPYIYGAIQAYLGPNTSDEFFGDYGYYEGLSGILKYALDVVASGGNPYPPYGPPVTEPGASTLAASVLPAALTAKLAAPAVVDTKAADTQVDQTKADETKAAETADDTKADDTKADDTKADDVAAEDVKADETAAEDVKADDTKPADTAESTETTEAPESTPEVEAPEVEAPKVPEVEVSETKPADIPAVEDIDVPAADAVKSAPVQAPAKPARPHPIRDAVEKVGKQINDALSGAKAKAGAAKAGAASDSAS